MPGGLSSEPSTPIGRPAPAGLAGDLWRQLGLDQFWAQKLAPSREGTDGARLLQISTAYRLIDPGSPAVAGALPSAVI